MFLRAHFIKPSSLYSLFLSAWFVTFSCRCGASVHYNFINILFTTSSPGLLLFQNGGPGEENPGQGCQNSLKVLEHFVAKKQNKKQDKLSSLRLRNRFRWPENRHGCQSLKKKPSGNAISSGVTWQNTPRLLQYFWSLFRDFYPSPPFWKWSWPCWRGWSVWYCEPFLF